MRTGVLTAARALALAGPTALAFFAGGYFDEARGWAGVGAWVGVFLAAVGGARLPRSRPAALALVSLALLAAWTLLSMLWAPVVGSAYHAGQIVLLYVGALLGSAMLFGDRSVRIVEPALAAGTLIVIGYGLSERLLPGLLQFSASLSADGRLEQPLTYWNAMGELAAIGIVLSVRLAGDGTRPRAMRSLAAGATAPLGLALYISFSRGALFACLAGLIALIVLAPTREQLGALVRGVAAAVLASAAGAPFQGVTSLIGTRSTRESQGAIALVILVVITGLAVLAQAIATRRERAGTLRIPRRSPLIAAAVICAGLALAIVLGAHETSRSHQTLSTGAERLTSLQSNRYAYWSVALRTFSSQPLHGVGAGAWSVYWLRWRHVSEAAQDAHSLPLQTLAELGLVGAVLLALFIVGTVLAARRGVGLTTLAAGPTAVWVVYLVHAPLDWDWEMPALTLVAMVALGAVLAMSDPSATTGSQTRSVSGP